VAGRGPEGASAADAPTPAVRPEVVPDPLPGVVDLVLRSARVGVDATVMAAGEVADFSVRVARSLLPTALAQRPLDAVDERLERQRRAARERGEQHAQEAREAASAVVNQAVVGVVDMIDVEALVDHVPMDKIIARVDVPKIINEVDLGSVVRESTSSLVGETVDAIRVQVMGVDLFASRITDKILRRKVPRPLVLDGYDVFGPEIRFPDELA
jgi:hypothetical protein